jgi:hypothetical protein
MAKPLSNRARHMAAIAEHAIKAGMKVLATAERSKVPDTRFCPNGLKDATESVAVVKTWLRVDDQINLAASVQGSGICVVDVDGLNGLKALRALSKLPPTRKTKTRNGSHRFYRYGGDLGGSVIKLAPDLDFILSGYVMLPGSEHPDGGRYESKDFGAPIVKLPAPLAKAIRNHRTRKRRSEKPPADDDRFAKGNRNNRLASIAGALRRQGGTEDLILTALHAINGSHCKPPLKDTEVERIGQSIGSYPPEHEGLFNVMSNVTPRDVAFLWDPYLVRDTVNLLEGDPNVGKTFLLCAIAAAVSSGTPLPGQTNVEPQGVLFMSAEDDPETTLIKRLMRMGADLSRVSFMTKFLRLEDDVFEQIERHVDERKVGVVILDPLLAYMRDGIDMNKANETRPFMARLAEFAKVRGVTVIALRHLNKADKDKAIFRGLGSVDITAAARSAVMVGLHPEDEHTRVLVHIKHNLSERGPSLLYDLSGGDKAKGLVPRLTWRGETTLTADDLARKPSPPGRPDTIISDARGFVSRTLVGGPQPVKKVQDEATRIGISETTLRRALRELRAIKADKMYRLPPKKRESSKNSPE